jgi:hypothetical protein
VWSQAEIAIYCIILTISNNITSGKDKTGNKKIRDCQELRGRGIDRQSTILYNTGMVATCHFVFTQT